MDHAPSTPLRAAIVYDFDGTLAPGNMQEHGLLPSHLGMDKAAFWARVKAEAARHDADEVLVYMRLLLEAGRAAGRPITREALAAAGRTLPFFAGVREWFARIDAHARARGLALEHHVVSSGSGEMIAACAISPALRQVFASRYVFDDAGAAVWPAVAINYTTKTQYLFRINKGVHNSWDHEAVNRWQPLDARPVPFSRMIYLGDGDTDIPSMKMVRHQGGHAVAVFDPDAWRAPETQRKVYHLIAEDRAHFVAPADYTEGSQLDVTVKGILGRIARDQAGHRARAA